MINCILYFISGFFPCRIIMVNDKPYLERYFITDKIFIHRFLSSDGDRHVHDHPWYWAFSIILTGKYHEELLDNEQESCKWFNFISSTHMHRITWIKPNTWTLFVTSKRTFNGWGFLNNETGKYIKADSPSDSETYTRYRYPLGKNCKDRKPL